MTPEKPASENGAISYRAFWITSAILLAFFLISIYVVMPRNVLSGPEVEKLRPEVSSIWPQGWGFFTKDPDSPNFDAYRAISAGVHESLLITPQGLPSNLFGLSRTSRAQGPEIALIHSKIEADAWVECEGINTACLSDAGRSAPLEIGNLSPQPTVCGDAILTQEKPTPWAYRDLVEERFRITHTVHVDVQCNGVRR